MALRIWDYVVTRLSRGGHVGFENIDDKLCIKLEVLWLFLWLIKDRRLLGCDTVHFGCARDGNNLSPSTSDLKTEAAPSYESWQHVQGIHKIMVRI
jgi:hypothetical protein